MLPLYLVIAAAILIFARSPELFLHPRFWGEEGTIFFSESLRLGWTELLLAPRFGYLNFFANITSLIAARLNLLDSAPLFTTLCAFLAQLVPVAVIAFSTSSHFNTINKKVLGILLMMFAGNTSELWLNSINSMSYLSAAVFLILLEDENTLSPMKNVNYGICLALSGLSGVLSCFLTPLFLLKAYKHKSKTVLIQALVLTSCTLIQIFYILKTAMLPELGVHGRMTGLSLGSFFEIFLNRTIIVSIFGTYCADLFYQLLISIKATHNRITGVLSAILSLAVVFIFLRKLEKFKALTLGLSLLLVSALIVNTINGDKNSLLHPLYGIRYFYLPDLIFLFILFLNVHWPLKDGSRMSKVAVLVLALALLTIPKKFREDLFIDPSWPNWKSELQEWRKNPAHPVRIWPTGWTVDLPKEY